MNEYHIHSVTRKVCESPCTTAAAPTCPGVVEALPTSTLNYSSSQPTLNSSASWLCSQHPQPPHLCHYVTMSLCHYSSMTLQRLLTGHRLPSSLHSYTLLKHWGKSWHLTTPSFHTMAPPSGSGWSVSSCPSASCYLSSSSNVSLALPHQIIVTSESSLPQASALGSLCLPCLCWAPAECRRRFPQIST